MSADLEHKSSETEETLQKQEKPDLSRRTFLTRLTILGVGCAAAMTLGVRDADAAVAIDAAGKAKDLADEALAEGKDEKLAEAEKAEFAHGVDPDDPLESFAQVRRRVARRRVRRVVRVRRRVVRRRVRRVRRVSRRVARRRVL